MMRPRSLFRAAALLAAALVLSLLPLGAGAAGAQAAQAPQAPVGQVVETPCGVRVYGPDSPEADEARYILTTYQGVELRPAMFQPDLSAWAEAVCSSILARPGLRAAARVVVLDDIMYLPSDIALVRARDGLPPLPDSVPSQPHGPADIRAGTGDGGAARAAGITLTGPAPTYPMIVLGVGADGLALTHEAGHVLADLAHIDLSGYLALRERLARENGVMDYHVSPAGWAHPGEVLAEDFALAFTPENDISPDAARGLAARGSTMPWPDEHPEWLSALRDYFQSAMSRVDAGAGAGSQCSSAVDCEIEARQDLLRLRADLADAEGESLREFLAALVAEREREVAKAAAARVTACREGG